MRKSNKLLSCLISALMFNSFCYGMEKEVPRDVPAAPKKKAIDTLKKTLGFKTTEEKAQKKLTAVSKNPTDQRKLAETEQKKLTAAQEQLQQAKQSLEKARAKDSAIENTFGYKIKSLLGITSSQKAQSKVDAAQAKLASKTARLQVYSKGLGLQDESAQAKLPTPTKTPRPFYDTSNQSLRQGSIAPQAKKPNPEEPFRTSAGSERMIAPSPKLPTDEEAEQAKKQPTPVSGLASRMALDPGATFSDAPAKKQTPEQAEQAKKLIADAQASRTDAQAFDRRTSYQSGVKTLSALDEKIKAIRATGNDPAELRELLSAKTNLELKLLDSAVERLVTKPKTQGKDLYVMDSMTRVSTAVEALKILRSFETEEGKKALEANPALQKLYAELSQKEQLLVAEAEKHRAAAEAEAKKTGAPAWKANAVEEYRRQIEQSRKAAKSAPAKESEKKAPGKTVAQLEAAPALTRETLSPKTSAAEVVKNILGVSEEEFVRMPPQDRAKYLTSEMIDGQRVYFLKDPNNPDAPKVRVGSYTQPTGADLEDRVAKRKAALQGQPRQGTSFSIIYQTNMSDGLQHVDTGNMQADPAYRDALFMVASNFSGLETVSERDTAAGQVKKISQYVGDRTQGPSAAMSTAAGTVFRTYFANCERYPDDPSKWPQAVGDGTRETNYLSGTGIETRNGYITEAGAASIGRLAEPNAFSRFSYGFQDGTQVTHTGLVDGSSHQRLNDPEQKVSQMYVAALDLGQGSSPLVAKLRNPNTPTAEKQKILDAAQRTLEMSYDAIIKEAFARGKTKIVLTRIGGGAFGNSPEMIDAAIKNALEKNKELLEMGGIHVTLNAFGQPNDAMRGITEQMGGTITEFGNGKKVETTVAGQ
ncbi:MAG: hypothetical protein WCS92_01415 [Candidatus Babeliales bacterium]|jgi:hypothetical protein